MWKMYTIFKVCMYLIDNVMYLIKIHQKNKIL